MHHATNVRAPILGLYGDEDRRVDATILAMDSAMKAMDKVYEHVVFDGANLAASKQAWPNTVA